MRDRYLINSDRHALEIAYLGRPLSASDRKGADAFYAKLSPEQQSAYSQRADVEFLLMWGSEPPNAKVAGQMKWVLRAEQLEKDYPGQVAREQKKDKTKEQKAQTALTSEPKGLFDGHYAEDYYKTLWKQGNTEHNVFKLFGGTVGGSIAAGYNGVTGLADKGAAGSANLVVQGQQQGGVGGFAKQTAGFATGMVFSLGTEDTLPQTAMTLGTMGFGGAAQAGKLGVFSKPIFRMMQVGGALMSGTSIGQGISGKNMFTGEDLSPGQRMFDLSFGALGAGLDLGGAGLSTNNLSKDFPTVMRILEGISPQNATLQGGRLGNQSGAVRLGGDGGTTQSRISKSLRSNPNEYDPNNSISSQTNNSDIVFSGHGEFVPGNGTIVVPTGTSVSVYSPFGGTITNRLGNAIETGEKLPQIFRRTYQPGEKLPNYSLLPPTEDIPILGNPRTVEEETLLKKLLEPDMGHCHWAACTYNDKSKNRHLAFDTEGVIDTEWYQYIQKYDQHKEINSF
jgi:hypothetical protein